VFVATVGGMRIKEPAADLALVLAVASAATGKALPPDLVAVGEVGLAGEVRRVHGVKSRLAEAARLGFVKALIPPDCEVPDGLRARVCPDLGAALDLLTEVGVER
jgi:DNA repair protein RadA/Sms